MKTRKKTPNDDYLRFDVLVPFYTTMESKRQKEAGKLTKESAHEIYDAAIDKIEEVIQARIQIALRDAFKTATELGQAIGKKELNK